MCNNKNYFRFIICNTFVHIAMWSLNLEYFDCIPKSKIEYLNCVSIAKVGYLTITRGKNKHKVKQIKFIVFLNTKSLV